jgi:hypothetical protein
MFTAHLTSCQSQDTPFIADRVQQTATITLNGPVSKVFPLFGIIREKEWDHQWNPTEVYPTSGHIDEGSIYRTPGHFHGEPPLIWVVSRYDTTESHVTYLVSATNRIVSIDIQCSTLPDARTQATITYTMTGLDAQGNQIIHQHITAIFQHQLQDWQTLINQALSRHQNPRAPCAIGFNLLSIRFEFR